MTNKFLIRSLAATLVLSAGVARAQPQDFDPGSLIIPMQASFQTDCGMVSAYGLIYRILQSNGVGHVNAANPITVYVTVGENKGSPNRCRPVWKMVSSTLTPVPFATGTTQPAGVNWDDGCDFSISKASGDPVVPFNAAGTWPVSGVFPAVAGGISVYRSNTGTAAAGTGNLNHWPQYNWSTFTPITGANFQEIRYLGGPFVIAASDAKKVYDLLNNGDNSLLPMNQYNQYKSACDGVSGRAAACGSLANAFPASYTSTTPGTGTTLANMGCHFINIHQAAATFTANVERRITEAPPPFALYDPSFSPDGGIPFTNINSTGGDSNREGGGGNRVLEKYLLVAGLMVSGTGTGMDSMGCPYGNVSKCTKNGSTAGTLGTPRTTGINHGAIFDLFTTYDINYRDGTYPGGLLNYKPTTQLFYRLFWAPHWNSYNGPIGGTVGGYTSGSITSNDFLGIQSLGIFNAQGGNVLGECASIPSWENGSEGTAAAGRSVGGVDAGTNFLFTNGVNYWSGSAENPPWGGSTATSGTRPDQAGASGSSARNCSDDPAGLAGDCITYTNYSDVFNQVGDWLYNTSTGTDQFHWPAQNSLRRAFNQTFVGTADGGGSPNFDVFNKGQNGTNGVVIYVGGHDVSGDPQGARIVLNSMLNLGSTPVLSERALAAPVVVYANDAGVPAVDELIIPTYDAVTGYSVNSAVRTFNYTTPDLWTFPYYPGKLRANGLSGGSVIANGENNFTSGSIWTLDVIAATNNTPVKRNLFTYLGGYPKLNPTTDGQRGVPNDMLQVGWKPENVSGTLLVSASETLGGSVNGCVDVMGFGTQVTSPIFNDGQQDPHLVIKSDGLCDLQQVMPLTSYGTTWSGTDLTNYQADKKKVAALLQIVRGFCWASAMSSSPNTAASYTPATTSLCIDTASDNLGRLGGLVHASPAVMLPSPNIQDINNKRRPVVAFSGGFDGQFHAVYLGGGVNYTGPVGWTSTSKNFPYDSATTNRDVHAAGKMSYDFAADFAAGTVPPAGTELWSYIPASQLGLLRNNSAQVDASAVVQDVFADFAGTGVREWHTLVVGSTGRNGAELFALDVTNPLKPRLLWDIIGNQDTVSGMPYSGTVLSNGYLDGGSQLPGRNDVHKWADGTTYNVGSPGDSKVYDYSDLGGINGLVVAPVRIGTQPHYLAFVASAMTKVSLASGQSGTSGKDGIQVFAIDVVTGQKKWQWQHEYNAGTQLQPPTATKPLYGNSTPPQVSVIYGAGGGSRILVGDQQGRLWELDAALGHNANIGTTAAVCGSVTPPCGLPAFDTNSATAGPNADVKPITTNIAVAKIPPPLPAPAISGSLSTNFAGATALIFGTGGVDWAYNPLPNTSLFGRVYVLLYDPAYRRSVNDPLSATLGVLKEPTLTNFPASTSSWQTVKTTTNGETVWGAVTVIGQIAFYSTAMKAIGNDIMTVDATAGGRMYALDLGLSNGNTVGALPSTIANYGGVVAYAPAGGGVSVLGSEVSKINRINLTGTNATNAAPNSNLSPISSLTFWLRNWLQRFLP